MKAATKDYVINTVFRTNILPVISECNTSCIFCSHKQNPPGIEVFSLQKMSMEDFEEIIGFLSPGKKIIIGESATRIIEGEPLLHENFIDILSMVRKKYKHTAIQVTTNGILLSETLIAEMVELGNIELNISINCTNPLKRKQILGLKGDGNIVEKIQMLAGRLKFSGSFVLVPGILESEDIEELVCLLNDNGADTVRAFLPGFTSRAKNANGYISTNGLGEMYESIYGLIERLRDKYTIPIIIEPSFITDLNCRVEGVIKDSPAWTAGVKTGDVILHVNEEGVRTRVEAFNKIYRLHNPELTIARGESLIKLKLAKRKNYPPGFVVLYDIDPELAEQIDTAVRRYKAQKILIITSALAFEILNRLFEIMDFTFDFNIITAKNSFFGGTIKCAGLLTVQDILDEAQEYLKCNEKPDLILLPPIMFDYKKTDLTGRSIKEIEQQLGIPVDTV